MASVAENLRHWSNRDWSDRGEKWSVSFGGTEAVWVWTVLPRVGAFLPAEHVLEIAPGCGRMTQYLVPACRTLTLVDLTPVCIETCRERFAAHEHIAFQVNDGRSLDVVKDGSVDFVFSWDSLVHVEEDVMVGYLEQLGSKLKPGGAGMLHHSNLGAYRDERSGGLTVANDHSRAPSMSAEKFRTFCRAAGLCCPIQELVAWSGTNFTDCFSAIIRPNNGSIVDNRTRVVENKRFRAQVEHRLAAEIRDIAALFRLQCSGFTGDRSR